MKVEMWELMDEGRRVKGGKKGEEMYVKEVGRERGMVVGVMMKWMEKEKKGEVKDMGWKGLGME